jgi:hypothetical protein
MPGRPRIAADRTWRENSAQPASERAERTAQGERTSSDGGHHDLQSPLRGAAAKSVQLIGPLRSYKRQSDFHFAYQELANLDLWCCHYRERSGDFRATALGRATQIEPVRRTIAIASLMEGRHGGCWTEPSMGMIRCRSRAGWTKDCFLAQVSNVWPTAQGREVEVVALKTGHSDREASSDCCQPWRRTGTPGHKRVPVTDCSAALQSRPMKPGSVCASSAGLPALPSAQACSPPMQKTSAWPGAFVSSPVPASSWLLLVMLLAFITVAATWLPPVTQAPGYCRMVWTCGRSIAQISTPATIQCTVVRHRQRVS